MAGAARGRPRGVRAHRRGRRLQALGAELTAFEEAEQQRLRRELELENRVLYAQLHGLDALDARDRGDYYSPGFEGLDYSPGFEVE